MSRTGSTARLAALVVLLMFLLSLGLSPASAYDADQAPPSSGHTSEPQPLSRADKNPGGANGDCPDGPYCSTRDGSPSENGKRDGEAVGKPCAGCVGKADNKNPKGQMPNGSDGNAGYECDTNQGVGRSNPAHTGCESAQVAGAEAERTTQEGDRARHPGAAEVLGVQATRAGALSAADPAANRTAPKVAPVAAVLPSTGSAPGHGLLLGAGLMLVAAGGATLALRGRTA